MKGFCAFFGRGELFKIFTFLIRLTFKGPYEIFSKIRLRGAFSKDQGAFFLGQGTYFHDLGELFLDQDQSFFIDHTFSS